MKIDELQLERPPGTSRKPPLELKLRKEQGELWASLRGEGVRAFPKCTLVQRSSETPFQEALGGGAGTGQSWGPAGSCGPASRPRLPLPPIPHPCQTPPAPRRTRFCGLCSQMCLYLSSTRTLTRVSCWCVSVSRFFKEKSQIPAPPPATCLPRENLPFNGETASGPRAAGDKVSPVEFRRLTLFSPSLGKPPPAYANVNGGHWQWSFQSILSKTNELFIERATQLLNQQILWGANHMQVPAWPLGWRAVNTAAPCPAPARPQGGLRRARP